MNVVIFLFIEGMICVFCVGCVERVLKVVFGVVNVVVNLVIEKVSIMMNDMVDCIVFVKVVENVGYEVLVSFSVLKVVFFEVLIEGMICVFCVGWVEKVFKVIFGVVNVVVNFVIEKVSIMMSGLVD